MAKRRTRKVGQSVTKALTRPNALADSREKRMSATLPIRSETGAAAMSPTARPAVATDTERADCDGEIRRSRVK
ncbi:hypothetical protein HMPREF3092_10100 [Brevibacterium sp. HMSC24B04]|nr:hypothetical protein HMPREF3092_10100 [Brevibacterium sp. HMSC24B04]